MAFRLAWLHLILDHFKSQGHVHLDCDITQTVTEQTFQLPAHSKSHVVFLLSYLHFTLAHSKGQGHAHFNCEYLK